MNRHQLALTLRENQNIGFGSLTTALAAITHQCEAQGLPAEQDAAVMLLLHQISTRCAIHNLTMLQYSEIADECADHLLAPHTKPSVDEYVLTPPVSGPNAGDAAWAIRQTREAIAAGDYQDLPIKAVELTVEQAWFMLANRREDLTLPDGLDGVIRTAFDSADTLLLIKVMDEARIEGVPVVVTAARESGVNAQINLFRNVIALGQNMAHQAQVRAMQEHLRQQPQNQITNEALDDMEVNEDD